MPEDDTVRARSRSGVAFAKVSGVLVVALSMAGLGLGLVLTTSLANDFSATVAVSRSALEAIDQTVTAVEEVATSMADSLEAASGSVDNVSDTIDNALTTIEEVSVFLEDELAPAIESVQTSMPAAIQTANAIDGTLRALSLVGVDYAPEEPFGESLTRVADALSGLPGELRTQGESLRDLVPSAEDLGGEADQLSESLQNLTEGLEGFTSLSESYQVTLAEAEVAIEQTDESASSTIWMTRGLIIALSIAGAAIGITLYAVGNSLEILHIRTDHLEMASEELVVVAPSSEVDQA